MRSQLVHETYATTLAAGVDPDHVALLKNNREHLAHYRRGMGLLRSSSETWPTDRFLVDAVLRACMLAPGLLELAARMPDVRIAELDAVENRPDARLMWLQQVDLGFLREVMTGRPTTIAELGELHDACATALETTGMTTATSAETRDAVHALVACARDRLELDITIDEARDNTFLDDVEQLQRERIELHAEKLPAVQMSLAEAAKGPADFMRHHPKLGNHVLIVWLRPDILARQLDGFEHVDDRYVLALQAAGVDGTGRAVVRLAVTNETEDPSELAAAFTKVETVILTTLSSIADAPPAARFTGDDDLFVVVDQPPVEAIRHAFDRGATLRWARFEVAGDRHLKGIAWELDALPGVVHLHLASEVGHVMMVRWLDSQPAQLAVADPHVLRSRLARIDAVVQHIVAAWHIIERQDRPDY